jgi:REP element-mobilizing transposase RayT
MKNRREIPNRQSNRLPHYDYSLAGAYFVTIVTWNHACLFGEIMEGEVQLNAKGRIVDHAWREIPAHFPGVTVEDFVVMPNHVHGVIWIKECDVGAGGKTELIHDVGARQELDRISGVGAAYMPPVRKAPLGVIVATFKAAVTREIHKIRGYSNLRVWHRNYYERVIRDERELEQIVDYIHANPVNWSADSENGNNHAY